VEKFLIAIAALLLATPAFAQTNAAPTPLDPLYQCAAIQGDQERLHCFDTAVASLRASHQHGDVVAIDRNQAEELRRQSFGLRLPAMARLFAGPEREELHVEAQVERIYMVRGLATFDLANGQTWQFTDPHRFNNVRVNDTVRVHNAAMGSYMLVSPRGGAGHRVRRVE
jgi:hypothetical protein